MHKLSRKLGALCRKLPGHNPLAQPSANKLAPHFLFEVKVLWCLIVRLQADGWSFVPILRDGRFKYAMAPRSKSKVSYFVITDQIATYHLVHGAQVADRYGEPRAPDISVQSEASGDQPTYESILGIWDAKLKGTTGGPTNKRISDQEFARFIIVRELLCPPEPSGGNDILSQWPPAFQICGLITNGLPPSEPDAFFFDRCVSTVEHFQSADSPCAPSRAKHLAHIASKQATATVGMTS